MTNKSKNSGNIRAIPTPTDAELDAAALARPVVRALVEALRRC